MTDVGRGSAGRKVAMAIAAHPDDIEFLMAGTLLLLGERGYELHYMNLSRGNCGSMAMGAKATARKRLGEAKAAARILGAHFHPPIANDLEIRFDTRSIRRVAAAIREAAPSILLTASPEDYMEDHEATSRLAVTSAFARGMPNFTTVPSRPAIPGECVVYHAPPHGLRDGLGRWVRSGLYVDVASVNSRKREALAAHQSQSAWLDATQGMGSYLNAMEAMSEELGRMSGVWRLAEGWRRHNPIGFAPADADPLREALGPLVQVDPNHAAAHKFPGP